MGSIYAFSIIYPSTYLSSLNLSIILNDNLYRVAREGLVIKMFKRDLFRQRGDAIKLE